MQLFLAKCFTKGFNDRYDVKKTHLKQEVSFLLLIIKVLIIHTSYI